MLIFIVYGELNSLNVFMYFVQEDMILHEYSKSDIRNIQKFPLIVKVTSLVKAGMI